MPFHLKDQILHFQLLSKKVEIRLMPFNCVSTVLFVCNRLDFSRLAFEGILREIIAVNSSEGYIKLYYL